MMELTDLHCHIMPYVDDGAANMEEALELLSIQAKQGVTDICLTPHLRKGMFNTPDSGVREMFSRLSGEAAKAHIPVRLYLSREYYYDSQFVERLETHELIPMGSKKVLLIEFSYTSSYKTLLEAAEKVRTAGYRPLFAHVERYHAIQEAPDLAKELIQKGVFLQMNAASILGTEGRVLKRTSKQLLDAHCVHMIASDTHDPEHRAPNLQECANYLEKKIGRNNTQLLLHKNPLTILNG